MWAIAGKLRHKQFIDKLRNIYANGTETRKESPVLKVVTEDWLIFLIMVLMLKLIWGWHKEWKRKYKAKVERLKRVNRNYAKQIENGYN